MAGSAHLHQTKRIIPVIRSEVEIAERQRLLKDRVIAFRHDRHEDAHIVPHVIAPELTRAVGQAIWMSLVR